MDCSPVDNNVIAHIELLARQNKARVLLLHVIHSHTLEQDRVLLKRAEKALEPHYRRLREGDVEVEIMLRSGEPDEEIMREIEGGAYDLVAMATHGHSFICDILFGSVSHTLKHKINVPLLLIGPTVNS